MPKLGIDTANPSGSNTPTNNCQDVSAPRKGAETFTNYSSSNPMQYDFDGSFQQLPLDIHLCIIHAPNSSFQDNLNLSLTCKKQNAVAKDPDSLRRYELLNDNVKYSKLPQFLLLSKEGTKIVKSMYQAEFGPLMRKKLNNKEISFSNALKTIKEHGPIDRHLPFTTEKAKDAYTKYSADKSVTHTEWFPIKKLIGPTRPSPLGMALTNEAVQYNVDHDILPMDELKKMSPSQQMALSNQWVADHIIKGTFTFDQVKKADPEVLDLLITHEAQEFIDKNLKTLMNRQLFPNGILAVPNLFERVPVGRVATANLWNNIGSGFTSYKTVYGLKINAEVQRLCEKQNPSENCAIQ